MYVRVLLYLKTIKCSLRCMRKAVNFLQRIVSISSAFLIAIETRTELTLDSMRHLSVSVLRVEVAVADQRMLLKE